MSPSSRHELLLAIARSDADKALAESTKSKYRSAVVSFLNFCYSESSVPVPSEALLMSFVSYSCRRVSHRTGMPVSPRTVEAYLSGLASAFRPSIPNIADITNSRAVRDVLKGCKHRFSAPIARKEPLLLQDLILVHSHGSHSFDQALFLAMITVGFHGLHRLGELTVPDDPRAFDPRKPISRLSLVVSDCCSFVRYTLPYSKNDPFFMGHTLSSADATSSAPAQCERCSRTSICKTAPSSSARAFSSPPKAAPPTTAGSCAASAGFSRKKSPATRCGRVAHRLWRGQACPWTTFRT